MPKYTPESVERVKELVPFINEEIILGGFYTPGVGVVDSLRAGTISEGQRFAIASREGALVVNNVALSAILGIVLLGTLSLAVILAHRFKHAVEPLA